MSALLANTTSAPNAAPTTPDYCAPNPTYEFVRMFMLVIYYVIFTISVFGICGNLLSFLILFKDRTVNTSLFYLTCLSVSDALLCLSFTLFDFHYGLYTRSYSLDMTSGANHFLKRIYSYTKNCRLLFSNFSDLLTLLIAVDRYIVVCWPLKAKRVITLNKSYVYTNVVVLITVCDQMKNFFKFTTVRIYDPCDGAEIWVQKFTKFAHNKYVRYYEVFARAPIFTFVPTVALFLITLRLVFTLKSAATARKSMTAASGSNRAASNSSDRSLTLTLVLISCLYIVKKSFNFAASVGNLMYIVNKVRSFNYGYFNTVQDLVRMIVASANFFIYCASRRRFREQLKAMICCGDKNR